jgi:hypothetical protein
MLNKLSDQIRGCYRHAEYCARKAAAQTDPSLKQDLLQTARRWLRLARSIGGQPDDALSAEAINLLADPPNEPTAAETPGTAIRNPAMLSVRVFETQSSFGWKVYSATKEMLGRGTAVTEKKARIEAFRAAMTYIDRLKDRSASTETSFH